MPEKKKQILVVDDELDVLSDVKSYLERHLAVDVTTAENGYKAVELLMQTPYDIYILDISMPGINGLTVLKDIRRLYGDVPVYVVTRWDGGAIADEVNGLGATYVPKPCPVKVLKLLLCKHYGWPFDPNKP